MDQAAFHREGKFTRCASAFRAGKSLSETGKDSGRAARNAGVPKASDQLQSAASTEQRTISALASATVISVGIAESLIYRIAGLALEIAKDDSTLAGNIGKPNSSKSSLSPAIDRNWTP